MEWPLSSTDSGVPDAGQAMKSLDTSSSDTSSLGGASTNWTAQVLTPVDQLAD